MPPYKETGVALRLALLAVFVCGQPSRTFAEDHRNAEEVAVTKPFPPYPAQAAQAHEQGDVLLRVQLSNGKVIDVTVIGGPTTLALPAARWIKLQWKFKAGTTGVFDLPIRFRYQPGRGVDSEVLYRPAPPYPPEAKRKKEEGNVLLLIKLKNGVITDVVPKSGPDDLASFAASWIKENWKFRAGLTKSYTLPIYFHNPSGNPVKPAVVVRIVVKKGAIVEITPVTGSPKAAAAAVDFIKKNWEFSPDQSGTFTLPVVLQQPPAK
jgi:hypothetical protein